jgi:Zn-dependent protease
MFQVPPQTRLDLKFSLFGIPVRVHPLFWFLTLLIGASSGNVIGLLIWVVAVFISILIHELGHSLMMRMYGQDSYIVLHMAGGLAVPTSSRRGGRWGNVGDESTQQILISLAGPFAGFLLAAIVLVTVATMGGFITMDWFLGIIPLPRAFLPDSSWIINSMIASLIWVNVFWGLINLMPVFPLDGGNVARQLFVKIYPWDGIRKSLWLSVVSGAVVAIVGLVFLRSIFIGLLFGFLALQSYQMLRGFGGSIY